MIRNLCCKCRDSYQAELRLIISRSLYVIMIRLSARISTIASVGICTHRLPRKIAQGFSRFELFQSLSCFEAAWLACTVSRSFTVCTRMSSLLDPNKIMADKQRVCIVGSGNWGSAISRIIGQNVTKQNIFEDRVTMYVYEEIINGRKLTEIINETHENVKYLPGHKLPENVVAVPDLVEAARDADILIFVIPHQFVYRICSTLLGKIKPTAIGISLIKGFDKKEGGGIQLISHVISKELNIPVSVLMGANLAPEVAKEMFCETTIGCRDKTVAPMLKDLIQTSYFRVVVVEDADSVECCGAIKNIVACGAGFVDGLRLGDNTKAAVIRLGLMEMIRFVNVFFSGGQLSTFFESCGVADLVTTCYGGRNRKVSEAFVTSGKTIVELEQEMLNGQKLQGPITAEEVNHMLRAKNMENAFPLFTAIHRICIGEIKPSDLIDCIRDHPEHMSDDLKATAEVSPTRSHL